MPASKEDLSGDVEAPIPMLENLLLSSRRQVEAMVVLISAGNWSLSLLMVVP